MGLTRITIAEVSKHLPARILSLGWPDNLAENLSLTGSTLDMIDLIPLHKVERALDLSVIQDLGQYDLVLDFGTLEHISNIAHGFINAASAVKPNGHIIHELPLNMINHGYWNVSPVWLEDFYRHNGFVIERMDRTLDAPFNESRILPWPTHPNQWYYTLSDAACLTLCVARRVDSKPVTLPRCQKMWING